MTAAAAITHVGDVVSVAVPTKGGGVWAVYWASWRVSCPWPVSRWMLSRSPATFGTAHRRRNPSELRTWAGRQKRRRRTILAGWDRQARWKARERARERMG